MCVFFEIWIYDPQPSHKEIQPKRFRTTKAGNAVFLRRFVDDFPHTLGLRRKPARMQSSQMKVCWLGVFFHPKKWKVLLGVDEESASWVMGVVNQQHTQIEEVFFG